MSLALKSNDKWQKIYYLSYSYSCSVNYYISKNWGAFEYTTFDKAKQEVIQVGPKNTIIKQDLKDDFWHIFVSPQDW